MTLKEARKKKGYTQEALGDMLGVSQQAIAQYEAKERQPNLEKIKRISDVLGVELNELVHMFTENKDSA